MIQRANFIKSSQLVIDIGNGSESLDASYLKVPALCVRPTDSVIVFCKDLTTLQQNADTLLTKDLVRDKYISQSYDHACKNTSFLFTAQLCQIIGEPQLSRAILHTQETLL